MTMLLTTRPHSSSNNLPQFFRNICTAQLCCSLEKQQNIEPFLFRSRADIFASLGDYTMAIVNYSQAIKLDPGNSEAFFQRAKLFEKTGKSTNY